MYFIGGHLENFLRRCFRKAYPPYHCVRDLTIFPLGEVERSKRIAEAFFLPDKELF